MSTHKTDVARLLTDSGVPDGDAAGIGAIVVLYKSRTQDGVWHRCSYAADTGFRCSCRGYFYRTRCRHVTDLRARLSGRPAVDAQSFTDGHTPDEHQITLHASAA